MSFYQVNDPEQLVSAMEKHIEKLQAKVATMPSSSFAPARPREG